MISVRSRRAEDFLFSTILDYRAIVKSEQIYNKSVSEKVQELSRQIEQASGEEELYQIVTEFYKKYGVGKFGLNKAFRISNDPKYGLLSPITTTGDMMLDDLIGYEQQKQKLIENTEAFVAGRKANNVLLFGDAGTGKSTSVKAILNQYYSRGLRMIEVYKHQFKDLSSVIAKIKNRNYRFIIYMDDLSFEEFEIEYKYLKAVIEGGLETKPDNILIYATSNRRHLIRETWSDRSDMSQDELHRSDTMQEKLSLVARFGVTIGYYRPSQQEYFDIVLELAKRYPEITLSEEELKLKANQWELSHGESQAERHSSLSIIWRECRRMIRKEEQFMQRDHKKSTWLKGMMLTAVLAAGIFMNISSVSAATGNWDGAQKAVVNAYKKYQTSVDVSAYNLNYATEYDNLKA